MFLSILHRCVLKQKLSLLRNIKHNIREKSSCAVHEIRIPVPWGYMRGKWWGRTDQRPLLAVHGFLDNCGTFNNIAPILAEKLNLGVLAVDLPGHGLSSNLPIGTYNDAASVQITIERIRQFMGWKKCSLFGHSFGAINVFLYSGIFGASSVDFAIGLDRLVPIYPESENHKDYAKKIRSFIRYDSLLHEKKPPKQYTYEEGIKKIRQSIYLAGAPEAVIKTMLERQFIPFKDDPSKYIFTTDSRLRLLFVVNWKEEDCLYLAQNLTMPFMNIKTDLIRFYGDKEAHYKLCKYLEQNNKNFSNLHFDEDHFVHLLTPEKILDPILDFIRRYDIQSRDDQKKDIFEEIRFESKGLPEKS